MESDFTAAALARIKAPRVAGKVAGKAPKETPPTTTTPKETPAGSEPVPDRIVVGRGEKTGRSTVPDPEGMTTTTLANKSAKPDLSGFLQDAPKDYPHLVGKIKEMFLERMGLTPAGSRAGVNPEGISFCSAIITTGRETHDPATTNCRRDSGASQDSAKGPASENRMGRHKVHRPRTRRGPSNGKEIIIGPPLLGLGRRGHV